MKYGKTILSQYGYQISLDHISKDKLAQIISELTVVPYKLDATKEEEEASKYKLFKYSKSKRSIIVPRYYGIQHFGLPVKIQFAPDVAIMPFIKELRPNQYEVMDKCIAYINEKGGGLLSVPCGFGKCLAKGTKILMFDGSIKNVEDVIVGDKLIGDDSTVRNVLSLARGEEEMYDIIDNITGEVYTVNKSHILSLKYIPNYTGNTLKLNEKIIKYGDTYDISVIDYITLCKNGYYAIMKDFKGYRVPIEFAENDDFDLQTNVNHFYECGRSINLSTKIDERLLRLSIKNRYHVLRGFLSKYRNVSSYTSYEETETCLVLDYHSARTESVNYFDTYGDSDIKNIVNMYEIYVIDREVIDQIKFLVRSLGYFCQSVKNANGSTKLKIVISDDFLNRVYPIRLKERSIDTYYGFEIDGNRRFVLGDCTVTHNTICALYLAHIFKLKTLVIVHKSFLLNQWIAKAKEFMGLNDEDIGIIKQNKCIVENKSIVIGMIHTIAKRDYVDVFNKFGFVIYDEAHHICCRFFSKAPMKIGGSKTLALTATPYRGDKLIKVMYWLTGGTIYQEQAKINKNVVVKLINYKSTYKKLFATKQRWFNGKQRPDTGKMTTNLCKIDSKNNALVTMINHMRINEPERKILVLSYRIEHLHSLKKAVDDLIKEDVDAGFMEEDELLTCMYVSKTKQADREIAEESGDIIFASYQMAEEGLDIKHLNTVILASPKKNIIQSIGRIMRSMLKAGDVRPMILDIADDLDVFNKWKDIRKARYIKCKYDIEEFYLKDETFMISKDYYDINKGNYFKPKPQSTLQFKKDICIDDEIKKLIKDKQDLEHAKKILCELNENRYDLLKEYKCIQKVIISSNDKMPLNDDDSSEDAPTDLNTILFVEKLTEADFDTTVIKDVNDDDNLDLDRDIKLGDRNNLDDSDDLDAAFEAPKPINVNRDIIKKSLFR